ncbi:hypothetical protein Tco_0174074 [Tanacetum coccineum]
MSNSKYQSCHTHSLKMLSLHNAIMDAGGGRGASKRIVHQVKTFNPLLSPKSTIPPYYWAEEYSYSAEDKISTPQLMLDPNGIVNCGKAIERRSRAERTVSYHKLYDILKQHQNEVNEIRTERLARTANPLALVAQQHTKQELIPIICTMAQLQEVTPDPVNNSGPIFDDEPMHKWWTTNNTIEFIRIYVLIELRWTRHETDDLDQEQ